MNRGRWTFGLMGGLALALSLAATPAQAQAEHQKLCFTTDLTGMLIGNQDCPTELLPVVLTSGTQTTCFHAVANTGGQAQGQGHAVGDGIGVDANGNSYLFHEDATAGLLVDIGETITVTEVASAQLIGLGSAPNEVADIVMRLIFDANGNLVNVIVDKATARCQG